MHEEVCVAEVEKEKVYKCLNPVGISLPVEAFPLAPRLNSVDGKTIWLSITGEPDITIPLERRLKSDYPNVNWKLKKTYGIVPIPLSEEEEKTADGLIMGYAGEVALYGGSCRTWRN
jgi:hypothetical protein